MNATVSLRPQVALFRRVCGAAALPAAVGLLAAVFVAGCAWPRAQPDRTRHFTLVPPDLPAPSAAAAGVVVGLHRVELPHHLNGPSPMVRTGAFEVRALGGARWAEPPGVAIGRVLAAALAADAGVGAVVVYPAPYAPDAAHDLRVSVRLAEGDRTAGMVRFAATWQWLDAEGRRVVEGVFEPPSAPWDGVDPAALVEALAAAVRALGEQVVAARPRH